ncbi:hypothetical protein [Phocaeicola sp.]
MRPYGAWKPSPDGYEGLPAPTSGHDLGSKIESKLFSGGHMGPPLRLYKNN